MKSASLVIATVLALSSSCDWPADPDPCAGECGAHAYTPCTCAPDDPCGYRHNGVCDSACRTVAVNALDDSHECTPPGPCGGECNARAYTPCTCAPDDPCGYRNDGVCDDGCYAIATNPLDDTSDCVPVDPCNGGCAAHVYTPCTCAPNDPCGYRHNGVCDDGCYAIATNPLDDSAECGPIFVDEDGDGIADADELYLAESFAPVLQFASNEAFDAHYPMWLLEPTTGGASIFYALGYYEDGGDDGSGAYAHLGDPEFVVVDLIDTPSGWEIGSVFLSAYYREASGDRSGWYPPGAFLYSGGTHPIVSVAAQEHAMFANPATCDANARTTWACDDGGPAAEVAIAASTNLGNPTLRLWDDINLEFDGTVYTEWYFTEVRFCGWWVFAGDPRNACSLDGYAGLISDWLYGL